MITNCLLCTLVGFIIGVLAFSSMLKDYAENHKPYTIDGKIYYLVEKE